MAVAAARAKLRDFSLLAEGYSSIPIFQLSIRRKNDMRTNWICDIVASFPDGTMIPTRKQSVTEHTIRH